MFATRISKSTATAVLITVMAAGAATLERAPAEQSTLSQPPPALDHVSLMVATMTNGDVERHWVTTDECVRISRAVAGGASVAAVRGDGVRTYISKANCSTRRVSPDVDLALASATR
jgi:hypothetical protein